MVVNSNRATTIALCISVATTFALSTLFIGISIVTISICKYHALLPATLSDLPLDLSQQLATSSTITLCIIIHKAIYRLYFHPLSHFPGPKIAAFTLAFEFYHDVIQDGQYTWTIQSLHAKYGPIIRISPHELHVSDPQFQDQLYGSVTRPRDRWKWALGMFGIDSGMLTTVSHELHRKRRAPLNPLFSKKAVAEFGPRIEGHVEKMCRRLEAYRGSVEPVRLDLVFGALTLDVVTDYSFGEPYGALDRDDFLEDVTIGLQEAAQSLHVNKFFPWSVPIMKSIPTWVVKILNPKMEELLLLQKRWARDVDVVMKDHQIQAPKQRTVFHSMLANPDLPASDRNALHLIATAQNIIGGGTTTTASHLTRTTFHVLNNPQYLVKLKTELELAIPDPENPPPLPALERLPYLSKCITEGHRISHGVSHRLQRIAHDPLSYKNYIIPPGTPIGMTPSINAMDQHMFPEPLIFNPERTNTTSFNPFGKGPRACLGINLAVAELYLCLAVAFRRFEFELYETVAEDVNVERDYFAGLARRGARGLRVLVK